ncbi:MAG: FkbM family methyltransferase [Thermosynechococcus sp.]
MLEWTLRSNLKVQIKNSSDWVIYNDVFVDGEYDPAIYPLMLNLGENNCLQVLDIGANVGFFTTRVFDLLIRNGFTPDQVFINLFEASPRICQDLSERLLYINNLGNFIRIHNGLVGQREGSARFSELEFTGMSSIYIEPEDTKTQEINFIDVEKVLNNDTRISLLKCDIEGSELMFLENYPSLMKRVDSAVFELHPNYCDTNRCMDLIRESGLSNYEILRELSYLSVIYFWR